MLDEKEFSVYYTILTLTWKKNNRLLVKVLLSWVEVALDIASETFGK